MNNDHKKKFEKLGIKYIPVDRFRTMGNSPSKFNKLTCVRAGHGFYKGFVLHIWDHAYRKPSQVEKLGLFICMNPYPEGHKRGWWREYWREDYPFPVKSPLGSAHWCEGHQWPECVSFYTLAEAKQTIDEIWHKVAEGVLDEQLV